MSKHYDLFHQVLISKVSNVTMIHFCPYYYTFLAFDRFPAHTIRHYVDGVLGFFYHWFLFRLPYGLSPFRSQRGIVIRLGLTLSL